MEDLCVLCTNSNFYTLDRERTISIAFLTLSIEDCRHVRGCKFNFLLTKSGCNTVSNNTQQFAPGTRSHPSLMLTDSPNNYSNSLQRESTPIVHTTSVCICSLIS